MKIPTYWTMKNGQKINVMDMDVHHLRNVLKMILSTTTKKVYSGIIVQAKINETPVQIANKTRFEIGSTGWIKAKQNAEFKLNGDMANEFNDSYPTDEDDIDHHEFESDLN